MKLVRFLLTFSLVAVHAAPPANAVTWHVDPVNGDDTSVGSALAPFRTLMRAAKAVNPGETVLAHPGVYFEHVKLERGGTAEAPVTFRSVEGAAQTIITGAHRDLREKKLSWEAVEDLPGLYCVPFAEESATLLCDELNLYFPQSRRRFSIRGRKLSHLGRPLEHFSGCQGGKAARR